MKDIATNIKSAIAILFLFLSGSNLPAQTNELTKLVTPTPSAEWSEANQKHEDAKKLIDVLGLEDNAKSNFPKIIAAVKSQFPQVPEKFWAESQSESNIQKYMEFYVETYEKHFTDEEIKGMIQFYTSPLGQKIISTTPKIMLETMAAGNKWGKELQENLEKREEDKRLGSTSGKMVDSAMKSAKETSSPPEKFSEAQKRSIVIAHGLNPDNWTIDDSGKNLVSIEKPPLDLDAANQPKPIPIPKDVHYLVQYNDMTYFCTEEPKPVGNGFKLNVYPSGTEVILSGNIQITKIR